MKHIQYKQYIIIVCFIFGVSLYLWLFISSVLPALKQMYDKQEKNQEEGVVITYLDIGQGDATFIEFPNQTQMLIDCAIDARILEALGRVMSYYDRTIDYLVITHPDLDHFGGCVDVLNRFEVKKIVYNGYSKEKSQYWDSFWQAIQTEGAEYIEIDSLRTWEIGEANIHVLYPDHSVVTTSTVPGYTGDTGSNNTSIVFRLGFGMMDALFTGDAEKELEEYLIKTYPSEIDVEVLKAGHHGSNSSSIDPFLAQVTPDVVTISSGRGNRYGHPAPRVLHRLKKTKATILRTDELGDIQVRLYKNRIVLNSR